MSWVWSSFSGARDLQRTDAACMFEPAVADRFVVADAFPAFCSFDCFIGAVESHSELVFLSRRQLRVIDRLDQRNGSVSDLCDGTTEVESAVVCVSDELPSISDFAVGLGVGFRGSCEESKDKF